MIIEIKVPQLSESIAEATLAAWHVNVGCAVLRDQNLVDIETDKVVLDCPSPAAGVLVEVLAQAGDLVQAQQIIARIDTEGVANINALEMSNKTAEKNLLENESTPRVMPAAQRILDEKGILANDVKGSGRGGRITKEDALLAEKSKNTMREKPDGKIMPSEQFNEEHFDNALQMSKEKASQAAFINANNAQNHTPNAATKMPNKLPAAPLVELPFADRPFQRVPMSRLRARIAERLLESQSNNAILTTFNEVNMRAVIALRKEYGAAFEKTHGVRLGLMGFFVKAAVFALQKYPILNSSVDGSDIVYHGFMDIGIAVSSKRGLVVPILRNAEQMNFADIERQIALFGQKAAEGKLSLEELTGGTFSISNGGVFGSMLSTPILNPPQSAILGVHATIERPIAENGQVVIAPMNYLALSYDHRIIDGREAVLGLVAMKEALEDPRRLLLGV